MNRANSKIYKAVIVGGGASGLALAIKLSNKFGGENVALIERLDRVGKKLLTTGNGQCNLTNKNCAISRFHSQNKGFFTEIINMYGEKAVIDFFNSLGVLTVCDGDKIYPYSKQASAVLDALRYKISALKTETYLGVSATKIINKNGEFEIALIDNGTIRAKNVIVAVGGCAQKHLGTDGSGYSLLENLGHKLTKLYPSIVQHKCQPNLVKGLKGLKQKVKISTKYNEKIISFTGDLLFTDYGVSGSAVFNISPYVSGRKEPIIEVDFCPDLSYTELKSAIKNIQNNSPYLKGENVLLSIMNLKIASTVLKNCGFDLSKGVKSYSAEDIAKAVKNYSIVITGSLGFDYAQVTKGGIDTADFDNKTLQSKLVSGLYATGEVLDVDGDCGGFNLTWAFSSAFAVADAIN